MSTSHLLAREVIGGHLTNIAGEDLGRVEDVVVDVEQNRLAYALLSFGGNLLHAGKRFAVPWSLLRPGNERGTFVIDIERSVLDAAPGFDPGTPPDFADREWGNAIHGHYGEPTYW